MLAGAFKVLEEAGIPVGPCTDMYIYRNPSKAKDIYWYMDPWGMCWIAARELKLSYHNPETKCPYYGNLNEVP